MSKLIPENCKAANNLDLGEVVGTGLGGDVYRVAYPSKPGKTAIVKKIAIRNTDDRTAYEHEVHVMRHLTTYCGVCPRLYDAMTCRDSHGEHGYIVMEEVEGTDLYALALREPLKVSTLKEIARTIHSMHLCRVLHGDLHAQNVLVTNRGVSIIDFGNSEIAREANPPHFNEETGEGILDSFNKPRPEKIAYDFDFACIYASLKYQVGIDDPLLDTIFLDGKKIDPEWIRPDWQDMEKTKFTKLDRDAPVDVKTSEETSPPQEQKPTAPVPVPFNLLYPFSFIPLRKYSRRRPRKSSRSKRSRRSKKSRRSKRSRRSKKSKPSRRSRKTRRSKRSSSKKSSRSKRSRRSRQSKAVSR
jgi:serine/threonine protein kinase